MAILLALAHKLLPPPKPADGLPYTSYLERASQIVDFCWTGWDSENGGGIRWHVSTEGPPFTNRNACSTSLTAVAALEVATILKAQRDTEARVTELVGWGRKCLDWVWKELVVAGGTMPTNEGLVKDGLVQDTAGGPWRIAGQTYT